MNIKSGVSWMASHPLAVGGVIFVGGLFVLYTMGFFKPKSSGAADYGTIYSLSSSAQTQANLALKLAEVTTTGEVAKAKLAYDTTMGINTYWADTQLKKTLADNQNQLNLRELDLDEQSNYMTILNAKNQFALNVAEFSTDQNLAELIRSGYLTAH